MRGKASRRIGAVVSGAAVVALAAPSPALAGPTPSTAVTRGVGSPPAHRVGQDEAAAHLAQRIRAELGNRADDVSVVIHDRRTGRVVRHNPAMRNHTASIVKVMILVALIHQRRQDGRPLTAGDRTLARVMITRSDNAAATTLFGRAGGAGGLQDLSERLGMTNTSAAGAWGRTLTTASDQVKLMDAIISGAAVPDRSDRRYVLALMGDVIPEQAWGVDTVPDGAHAQVKNGWAPLQPRSLGWRVNSIGHVTGPGRDYTMAMLSRRNADEAQGRTVLNRVAKLVYREIGGATAPNGSPAWLTSPGHAFPPYPAW